MCWCNCDAVTAAGSFISGRTFSSKCSPFGGAKQESEKFEREFWGGSDLQRCFSAHQWSQETGTLERIFEAGFREVLKHRTPAWHGRQRRDGRHAPCHARHLPARNGQARIAPVVSRLGRFGQPLRRFVRHGVGHHECVSRPGECGAGNAAHVAPGIAEALIATAMGLFAAIPAVVAYNRFTHDIDRLAIRFESFMEEFSNILQRQLHTTVTEKYVP